MPSLTKTVAAIALFMTAFASSASANTYRQIDQLAQVIERQGQALVQETRHYRHTPDYRYLLADARAICQCADHIHDVARRRGSLAHLEQDLRQLGAKFHHITGLFENIEYQAAYGHGHVHGNTAHVKRLLCSMEQNIHRLCDYVRLLQRPVRSYRAPVVTTPRYNPRVIPSHPAFTLDRSRYGYGLPAGYGARTTNRPNFSRPPLHSVHSSQYRAPGITIGGGSSRFTIRF